MLDIYQEYLEDPTTDHFIQLQQEVLEEDDFDSQGSIVYRLAQLCETNDFSTAYQLTTEMPYSWTTSPAVHLFASIAAEKMGQYSEAETEAFLVETILTGLLSTGDGTLEAPYRITQQTDVWDILAYKSLEKVSQRLIGTALGPVDMITCENGQVICFDLSLIKQQKRILRQKPLHSRYRPRLAQNRLNFLG